MTCEEFWHSDPRLYWAYHDHYFEEQKEKQLLLDWEAWRHGLYVYQAISISLSHAFAGKKRGRSLEYPSEPLTMEKLVDEELSDEELLARQQREHIAKMKAFHSSLTNVPIYTKI